MAVAFTTKTAHPQFFDPMIRPVDASPGAGRLTELSGKLREFLAGPSVCERTDDDKTIILMSVA